MVVACPQPGQVVVTTSKVVSLVAGGRRVVRAIGLLLLLDCPMVFYPSPEEPEEFASLVFFLVAGGGHGKPPRTERGAHPGRGGRGPWVFRVLQNLGRVSHPFP